MVLSEGKVLFLSGQEMKNLNKSYNVSRMEPGEPCYRTLRKGFQEHKDPIKVFFIFYLFLSRVLIEPCMVHVDNL